MEQTNRAPIRRPRRNRYAAPAGGAILALAIIGLVAIIFGSIRLTSRLLDNSKEVERLQRILMPVVMFDPVPFDKIEDADPVMVLQSSLWTALYSDKRGSYTTDDNNMMLVPASDVEVACKGLFGPFANLQHQTFGDLDYTYIYDEENNLYRVPVMAQAGYYSPSLDKKDIVKSKDNKELLDLRVGYLAPGAPWLTDTTGKKYSPTPDKYMIYQVRQEKNNYYIVAIKDPGETAGGGSQAQPVYPKATPEPSSSSAEDNPV